MIPLHTMFWIAGIFPIGSIGLGFAVKRRWNRIWPATLAVLVVTIGSLWLWFTMTFWSWLLLYLFLCWFGAFISYYLDAAKRSVRPIEDTDANL